MVDGDRLMVLIHKSIDHALDDPKSSYLERVAATSAYYDVLGMVYTMMHKKPAPPPRADRE